MRANRRRLGLNTGVKCSMTDAYPRIDQLRNNMIYAMVKPTFTMQDVREWLWSDEVWDILKKARPYAYKGYGTYRSGITIDGARYTIEFVVGNEVAAPQCDCMTDRHPEIMETIDEILGWAARFAEVRRVVAWLEKHATPGAVRYYWPSACSLVKDHHPVNQASNERYREPDGVAQWIPKFRETSVTVAQALLCPTPTIPKQGFSISLPDSSMFAVL